MIRVDDPSLYAASLAALKRVTAGSYYGRLVQIFLACKHYGGLIPRVGDPIGTDVGTFQQLLDDLYEKPSLRPQPSVVILFSNNHLPRTGERGPNRGHPSNIWRNNFNIQKGFGCYATAPELQTRTFRNGSRTVCPHLIPATPGELRGATCALENQARYRNEDHPKVFRIDPTTRDLFIYDPSDSSHYAPLVLAPDGRRLPIGPLVVALYYDSPLAAGRQQVDLSDFLIDFDFTAAEFATYFDDDPAHADHAALSTAFRGRLSWTRIAAAAPTPAVAPLPATPKVSLKLARRGAPAASVASATSPPAGGHWWHAEQAVHQVLVADGWTVINKTRFGLGYDLLASKAGTMRYIEVKSSAGRCAPILTEHEYDEARRLRSEYVIAVVENFDPAKPVSVRWVQDPAALSLGTRQITIFSLPRSQWLPRANDRPS
jgi:hypothetical protein